MAKYFTCSECGDDVPVRDMSAGSLRLAGTETRTQALAVLEENHITCKWCEAEDLGEVDDDLITTSYAWADPEVRRLAGIDPGKWAAQQQSY